MTLLELQRRMAAAVMRPLTAEDTMQALTAEGRSMQEEAAAFIRPNRHLSSFERLEIYNRQYWFRLISAFSEDFPALEAVVGARAFERLTRAYLADCPSESFTLRNLGARLPEWLRTHPEHAGKRPALALDVARLEWAYVESFDEAGERALTTADLARLDGDSQLSLQPHLRLLALAHAVDDFVIHAHRRQGMQGTASNAVTEVKTARRRRAPGAVKAEPLFLAVHRHENAVYYKRLEPEAYRLLRALADGHTLAEALGAAFAESAMPEAEQPAHVQAWFANFAELGWFCRHRPRARRVN